jgi:hypothetical protein
MVFDSGGYALRSDKLSVFAATTSGELVSVISDATGSGALVFGTSPTIITPTIGSFVNAGHSHLNADGGGTLTAAAIIDLESAVIAFTKKTSAISQGTDEADFVASSGVPGGSSGQVQYNSGGTFGGDANFTWNATNGLTVGKPSTYTLGGATSGAILLNRVQFNESGIPDFSSVVAMYPGANGATVRDNTYAFGYNVGTTGKQITGKHRFAWTLESDYTTPETIRQLEFYYDYHNPSATMNVRPLAITIGIATDGVVVNTQADRVDHWNKALTIKHASFGIDGPFFAGSNAFFNNDDFRAQLNFELLSAQRLYVFPNQSGTFVLTDTSNLTTLSGGLTTGTGGTSAQSLFTLYVRSRTNLGTQMILNAGAGEWIMFQGRSNGSNPSTVFGPASGQTGATTEFWDSTNNVRAAVMPDGKVYCTSLGIGANAHRNVRATISCTPTNNRAITLPDVAGTLAVLGAVTTEAVTSDRTIVVTVGGVTYKLLARA